jgi:hypothetical protein
MNRSILIMAAVAAMAGPLGTTARAEQNAVPEAKQESVSTVMGYHVVSIAPRWVDEIDGKRTRHLIGADIRIAAQPGMTAEYLTVELRQHLATGSAQPSTLEPVFGVKGSSVDVRSTGDGFVFHVVAPDTKRAEEIVRRARILG